VVLFPLEIWNAWGPLLLFTAATAATVGDSGSGGGGAVAAAVAVAVAAAVVV
jgi:hypothetical protein